jgi:hypothetical protein
MPKDMADITPQESLRYKREVLARQFIRIRETVRQVSPQTQIGFNVPFWNVAEDLWVDHPMLQGRDYLVAESTHDDFLEWLPAQRKPDQRVMTTIIGRIDAGQCDPSSWKKWYARDVDFTGYAWGTPPDFIPIHTTPTNLKSVKMPIEKSS